MVCHLGQARSCRTPVRATTLTDQNTFDRDRSHSYERECPRIHSTEKSIEHTSVAPFRPPSGSPPCHRLMRRPGCLPVAASVSIGTRPLPSNELREDTSIRSLQPTCYQRAPSGSPESRVPGLHPSSASSHSAPRGSAPKHGRRHGVVRSRSAHRKRFTNLE